MPSIFELNGGLIGPAVNYQRNVLAIEFVGDVVESGILASSIDLPSGLQEDDVVFIITFEDSGSAAHPGPTGYTTDSFISDVGDTTIFYKVMGATPDTTASGLRSDEDCAHSAFAIRGLDTTSVTDVTTNINTGGSGEPNPPSITPTTDGCLILAIGHLEDDLLGASNEPPTGYTSLIFGEFGVSGNGGSFAVAYKIQETAAAEDPSAFDFGVLTSDDWNAFTMALKPSPNLGQTSATGSGVFDLNFIHREVVGV